MEEPNGFVDHRIDSDKILILGNKFLDAFALSPDLSDETLLFSVFNVPVIVDAVVFLEQD